MNLISLFVRIVVIAITCVGVISFAPSAGGETLDGQATINAVYIEKDTTEQIRHDSLGDYTATKSVETRMTFDLTQKIKYHKESDGESAQLVPDPQRLMRSTYSQTGTEHSASPGFKGIPTTSDYQGSATGTLVAKDEMVGFAFTDRGVVVNLMPNFTIAMKASGETRSFATKGTIDHPHDYQEVTPYAGSLMLPDNGSNLALNFQVMPAIPPQRADEDPNITVQRLMMADPISAFIGEAWTGASTTRTKNSIKIMFRGKRSDPIAAQQTEESKSQDTKVSRNHTKELELTVVLLIGTPPPAEMFIEPEKVADYDQWLPVPVGDTPEVEQLYGTGHPVNFHVSFHSKDPKNPNIAGPMDFYLRDVSQHLGRCGNEPMDTDRAIEPDLRFAKQQPGGVKVDELNPQHASISSDVAEVVIAVEATDAGAYGKLVAVSESLGLRAVCKRTNEDFISVPLDDNHNHIADGWEKSQKILDKNYPASWDQEADPKGDTKGDCLTLYEEYRGLVIDAVVKPATLQSAAKRERKWQRFDVGSKKLFVYPDEDRDKEIYISGATLFANASNVRVFYVAKKDDLKAVDDQVANDEYMTLSPRWLNFNSKPDLGNEFDRRAFAVVIKALAFKAPIRSTPRAVKGVFARTKELKGVQETDPFAPERIDAVYVLRDRAYEYVEARIKEFPPGKDHYDPDYEAAAQKIAKERNVKLNFKTFAATMTALEPRLIDRVLVFTIAHELGHAVGMDHHHLDDFNTWWNEGGKDADEGAAGEKKGTLFGLGQATCPMRYWDTEEHLDLRMLFISGEWNPAANSPNGQPWRFCNEDHCMPKLRLRLKSQ